MSNPLRLVCGLLLQILNPLTKILERLRVSLVRKKKCVIAWISCGLFCYAIDLGFLDEIQMLLFLV